MGTLDSGGDNIMELDDSGCVQDDVSASRMSPENGRVSLLDLSDDVLLEVLKYCEPRDLKALGFTCPRLGTLIQDRTLWSVVEERSHPVSKARLRWYLQNVLDEGTKSLLLTGYARQAARCLAHQAKQNSAPLNLVVTPDTATSSTQTDEEVSDNAQPSTSAAPSKCHHKTCSHCPPITSVSATPPVLPPTSPRPSTCQACQACPPQFTLDGLLMYRLSSQCSRLERLSLEYCNIDCNQTKLSQFPRCLKYLSLRGSKCYNLPIDKSFMFQVNDWLPQLEEVEVSECGWLEGCVLLPLSKLPKLYKLSARDCRKLSEFIAYASLAARYGFRALKVLDVRGSPLRDSEVSAFSWCPSLEELHLAASRAVRGGGQVSDHVHYKEEELEAWETEGPEYFHDEKDVEEEITKKEVQTAAPPYFAWDNSALHYTVMADSGITNVLTITLNQNMGINSLNISSENVTQANQNGGQNQDGGGPSGNAQNDINNQNGGTNDGDNQNGDGQKNGIDMTTQRNQENSNQDGAGPSTVQNGAEIEKEKVTDQNRGTKRVADDSSSDEDDVPKKASKLADAETSTSNENESHKNTQKFVRFRRNQPPVVVNQEIGRSPQNIRNQEQNGNVPLNLVANQDATRNAYARLLNRLEQNANQANRFPNLRNVENNEQNPRNAEPDLASNHNLPRDEPAIRVINENEPRLESDPEGRYHVLYVNVGRQMHAEYEVSLEHERPVCRQILPNGGQMPPIGQQMPPIGQQIPPISLRIPPIDVRCQTNNDPNRWDNYRRQLRDIHRQIHNMASVDVDSSTFVTDNALQRFGTQEVANIVERGPRGEIVINAPRDNGKPKQSKLKVLVCTGYRHVTNASLVHLAATAPYLRFIDLTGTNVTAQGVENFKILRPDCEVKFGGSKLVDS